MALESGVDARYSAVSWAARVRFVNSDRALDVQRLVAEARAARTAAAASPSCLLPESVAGKGIPVHSDQALGVQRLVAEARAGRIAAGGGRQHRALSPFGGQRSEMGGGIPVAIVERGEGKGSMYNGGGGDAPPRIIPHPACTLTRGRAGPTTPSIGLVSRLHRRLALHR